MEGKWLWINLPKERYRLKKISWPLTCKTSKYSWCSWNSVNLLKNDYTKHHKIYNQKGYTFHTLSYFLLFSFFLEFQIVAITYKLLCYILYLWMIFHIESFLNYAMSHKKTFNECNILQIWLQKNKSEIPQQRLCMQACWHLWNWNFFH